MADAAGILCNIIRLHGARWNHNGESGVIHSERVRHFHADVLPYLLDSGMLHMFALYLDNTIAAIYYSFSVRRRAYYYLDGFNPDFHNVEPGHLVVYHALEMGFDENILSFEFLRGGEPYKYRWGAEDTWTYQWIY